jgi:RNase adaptor protein for sRNA GlmZ degradation
MYKNNFATSLEKKLFIEYVKYANGIINSQSMKALDEQIATYIHKQSREYITINNIVNDTNISKEKEILITLDNLKSLEINTQNIINNGVEQAMKKAFKQTLLFA